MSKLYAFFRDEKGATAIEYGLIAAGISVVIIGAVNAIGSTLNTNFEHQLHQHLDPIELSSANSSVTPKAAPSWRSFR